MVTLEDDTVGCRRAHVQPATFRYKQGQIMSRVRLAYQVFYIIKVQWRRLPGCAHIADCPHVVRSTEGTSPGQLVV